MHPTPPHKGLKEQETMAEQTMTEIQFEDTLKECADLFERKLHDYGASWRILRATSLTDQLLIKAKRIRSLEIKRTALVDEGIRPEFIALVNYGIVGLIQLDKGFADEVDLTPRRGHEPLSRVCQRGSATDAQKEPRL